MSKPIIFIQVHGRPEILEAELSEAATVGELYDALAAAGIEMNAETFIFIDEAEEHQTGERNHPIHGIRHGSRIHVCHCKRIKTTVHFLHNTAEREFAPGARVRAVKEWAVEKLKLNPKDAAEHVLQLCNSTKRPPSDTRLNELVQRHECAVCFDLVPEKRVEG
jgi:hypothetical protein